MDPLPGSNTGFPLPPEGYLRGVRELCDKHGILLIFDEVQTGFGKTGKWFFCEHERVTPDIMTLGKGLSGGFIPLGVTMTTPKVARVFQQGPGHELRSGSTYGGHTVACAATLASIQIIERERLVENARRMGQYMRQQLDAMQQRHAIIKELSGIGLLLAITLRADAKVGTWIRDWCWRNGMILRNNGNILVLAPPLIITRRQVDEMLGLMDQAFTAAEKKFELG
jgi:adenosylmethionine-8-amino-7-oxononanoate aminotransferase